MPLAQLTAKVAQGKALLARIGQLLPGRIELTADAQALARALA